MDYCVLRVCSLFGVPVPVGRVRTGRLSSAGRGSGVPLIPKDWLTVENTSGSRRRKAHKLVVSGFRAVFWPAMYSRQVYAQNPKSPHRTFLLDTHPRHVYVSGSFVTELGLTPVVSAFPYSATFPLLRGLHWREEMGSWPCNSTPLPHTKGTNCLSYSWS